MRKINMNIPKEVKFIISELEKNGFESFIVGGCVRDLFNGKEPNDWDVATLAEPKEIEKIFPENYANNDFGTVTVRIKKTKDDFFEAEVTPYRIESRYTDKRHPDEIKWAKSIEEDLKRRDFTVNAMALGIRFISSMEPQPLGQIYGKGAGGTYPEEKMKIDIIDLFEGRKDLKSKTIRAVGKAKDRFSEDALRMMRAVRFASTLGAGWKIEEKTKKAIKENAHLLSVISKERIRDELMKIIMSERAKQGIELLRELDLLKHVIPELEEGYGVSQNKHHTYEIYDHNLRCLGYASEKGYNKYVRLAALLHDIAKPRTKEGEGIDATFYGHEIEGAKMTRDILRRLKFSGKDIKKVVTLVRYHLFYYNVDEVSESSVRRLVRNVGYENIEELLQVRYCDRIGSGCPKAEPYKLRHLKYLIEKTSHDPISVKMLAVSGSDVMDILKIFPCSKIGQVLDILLGHVLSYPKKNKKDVLTKEIERLGKLKDEELKDLAEKSRKETREVEMKMDFMTKKKYWVS